MPPHRFVRPTILAISRGALSASIVCSMSVLSSFRTKVTNNPPNTNTPEHEKKPKRNLHETKR